MHCLTAGEAGQALLAGLAAGGNPGGEKLVDLGSGKEQFPNIQEYLKQPNQLQEFCDCLLHVEEYMTQNMPLPFQQKKKLPLNNKALSDVPCKDICQHELQALTLQLKPLATQSSLFSW